MAVLRPLLDAVSPSRTFRSVDTTHQIALRIAVQSASFRRSSRCSQSPISVAIRITSSRFACPTRAADRHEDRRRPPMPAYAMVGCCVLFCRFGLACSKRQRKRGGERTDSRIRNVQLFRPMTISLLGRIFSTRGPILMNLFFIGMFWDMRNRLEACLGSNPKL
jgi:hypothetical protein